MEMQKKIFEKLMGTELVSKCLNKIARNIDNH